MEVKAQLKDLRIAPRKVRLVSGLIKGMDALAAKHQLNHFIKKSSRPLSKLLDSALANAHNNFQLPKENLFIKNIVVNEGTKLKRFRPKALGMTSPIQKKTSHITIVLEEKVPGLKAEKVKAKTETPTMKAQPESKKEVSPTQAKPEIRKAIGKKGGLFGRVSGLGRKFFRRKAI